MSSDCENLPSRYSTIVYKNKSNEICHLRPSSEQLNIITSNMHQDQKIIACAGSGKTTTLIARLKYLLDNNVAPESILISTFNVEAGRHIQNRARELLGIEAASKIEIGNIDKIAFRLYSEYIKENQSLQAKQFGLSVKEYCFELFKFLQTRQGIKHVLDKYKYFFFDEFQDVNELQYDILMLFKKHGCYLIVIGDDAQNIYGWRDSRIDIIQSRIDNDIRQFQGASIKTYMLSTNFRCSKPITLFSNQIIIGSKNLIQKSMKHQERLMIQEEADQSQQQQQQYSQIIQSQRKLLQQSQKQPSTQQKQMSQQSSKGGDKLANYVGQSQDMKLIENDNDAIITTEEQENINNMINENNNNNQIYKPYLQCYKGLYHQNEEIIGQIKKKLKKYKMNEIAILCPTNQPLKFFEETLEKHNQKNEVPIQYVSLIGNGTQNSGLTNQQIRQIADKKVERITLSTIHRAKGLEWKVVFFIGVNDEYFPSNFIRDPIQSIARLEECRRLFYVGCTRAIDELHFAMTKTARCHKVCRFFSDISDDLYEKDLEISATDIKFDTESIQKEFERDINVAHIIEEMDHRDFSFVDKYLEGVRESESALIHQYSQVKEVDIKQHNLFVDLSLFLDLYIQRSLGEEFRAENAYTCEYARTVLFTLVWKTDKGDFIKKYQPFFFSKTLSFDEMETPTDFENGFKFYLQQKGGDPNEIEVTVANNKQILEDIFVIIRSSMETNKVQYGLLQHVCVDDATYQIKEYFPEDFSKDAYIKSFNKFSNPKKKTKDILYDIYQVSKCGQLVDMTRKVLYRNDFNTINPPNLQENIAKFIEHLKMFNYQRMRVKHIVQHGTVLKGKVDLLADSTIYEIKASQYQYITKEYILQVLAIAALIKIVENIDITFICFYNPLIGKISIYNLSTWPFAEDYVKFLTKKSMIQSEMRMREFDDCDVDEFSTEMFLREMQAGERMQMSQSQKGGGGGDWGSLNSMIQQKIQQDNNNNNNKQSQKSPFNISEFIQPVSRTRGNKQQTMSQQQQSSEEQDGYLSQSSCQSGQSSYKDFKNYVRTESISLERKSSKKQRKNRIEHIVIEEDSDESDKQTPSKKRKQSNQLKSPSIFPVKQEDQGKDFIEIE